MSLRQRNIPVNDRIRDWLMDTSGRKKLSEADQVVWGRLQTLRSLLTENAYSLHDALKVMQKSYDISEATYWRDVSGVFLIFGDVVESNRQAQKWILYELGMKTFQLAAKKEDVKAMASAHRNLLALMGFDRDEADGIDPEKLNPGMYALVLDEQAKEFFENLLVGQGSVNLSVFTKKQEFDEAEIIVDKGVDTEGDNEAGKEG